MVPKGTQEPPHRLKCHRRSCPKAATSPCLHREHATLAQKTWYREPQKLCPRGFAPLGGTAQDAHFWDFGTEVAPYDIGYLQSLESFRKSQRKQNLAIPETRCLCFRCQSPALCQRLPRGILIIHRHAKKFDPGGFASTPECMICGAWQPCGAT